jgi:hypothetical protein
LILTIISAALMLAAAFGALAVAPSAVGLTPDETAAQRIIYFMCRLPGSACWPLA